MIGGVVPLKNNTRTQALAHAQIMYMKFWKAMDMSGERVGGVVG